MIDRTFAASAAFICAALLSGCAGKIVSTSERTVVVNAASQNIAEAQALGDAGCAQYGRKARLARLPREDRTFIFDCER